MKTSITDFHFHFSPFHL